MNEKEKRRLLTLAKRLKEKGYSEEQINEILKKEINKKKNIFLSQAKIINKTIIKKIIVILIIVIFVYFFLKTFQYFKYTTRPYYYVLLHDSSNNAFSLNNNTESLVTIYQRYMPKIITNNISEEELKEYYSNLVKILEKNSSSHEEILALNLILQPLSIEKLKILNDPIISTMFYNKVCDEVKKNYYLQDMEINNTKEEILKKSNYINIKLENKINETLMSVVFQKLEEINERTENLIFLVDVIDKMLLLKSKKCLDDNETVKLILDMYSIDEILEEMSNNIEEKSNTDEIKMKTLKSIIITDLLMLRTYIRYYSFHYFLYLKRNDVFYNSKQSDKLRIIQNLSCNPDKWNEIIKYIKKYYDLYIFNSTEIFESVTNSSSEIIKEIDTTQKREELIDIGLIRKYLEINFLCENKIDDEIYLKFMQKCIEYNNKEVYNAFCQYIGQLQQQILKMS